MKPSRFMRARAMLRAYSKLISFESCLARDDFAGLYHRVRTLPVANRTFHDSTTKQVCEAVDLACVFYWKEVLCLQRSAATTCLLRQNGVPAHLVLGAQQLPFKSHAWVEVKGEVVNDKSHVQEIYAVLDRC